MIKSKLIKIIEHFQSLMRKSKFDPDEGRFLGLPGHPIDYFEESMLCLYLVMTIKKIKSLRGLWRYISDRENRYVAKTCGFAKIPCYETIRVRIQKMQPVMERAISHIGNYFIDSNLVDPRYVAVDSRMFEAQGPKWHASDRKQNRIPDNLRNVDTDSTWGKSKYRGWVQGYSLNIVCVATPKQLPLPLLARPHDNSACENKVFKKMIWQLHPSIRGVLGDQTYDDKNLYPRIERKDENGHFCRRLVSPIDMQSLGATSSAQRWQRAKFVNSTRGRKWYSRRQASVERIFGHLIDTFDARKVWFKGRKYCFPFLLMLVLSYQALCYFNFVKGSTNIASVKPLIQRL